MFKIEQQVFYISVLIVLLDKSSPEGIDGVIKCKFSANEYFICF